MSTNAENNHQALSNNNTFNNILMSYELRMHNDWNAKTLVLITNILLNNLHYYFTLSYLEDKCKAFNIFVHECSEGCLITSFWIALYY